MPSRKRTVRQAGIVLAFAERLRGTRQARGMTQRELAERAEVTFTYISRLEAGESAPGIDLIERLARALGVGVTDLLPATTEAGTTDENRGRVKGLFEAVLPKAGPETLTMIGVFLARVAESPSVSR